MKKVIGRYNGLEYEVELDGEIVYTAGNSPHDSQFYASLEDGIGIEAMRTFCKSTSQDIAKENNAQYIGIEILER